MKLNAKMLYEAIIDSEQVTLKGRAADTCSLRFLCFYDGDTSHLMPGGVYLADPDIIPKEIPCSDDILWITWKSFNGNDITCEPILIFENNSDPKIIFNKLQNVFITFTTWEDRLDYVLQAGGSVQEIIDAGETLFKHPLCVVDQTMGYLGYSTSFSGADLKITLSDEPAPAVFYDPDQDLVRVLSDGDLTLGTLYMFHNGKPFSTTERNLFQILQKKLTHAAQRLSLLSGVYKNAFKEELQSLFDTGVTEEESLYSSLSCWGGSRGDTFICYKVKASHVNQKVNANYICSVFENTLHSAVAFWYDSVLVVLVDITCNSWDEEQIHGKMRDLLNGLHLKAGVSIPFTNLTKAWNYFRQACCAFEEGYLVCSECTLYFFQDYAPSYMLHHVKGEFSAGYLMDLGLRRIIEHDKQYSISYLDTLNAYFKCRMNMSQTADSLGIHRTSLNTRMQKIWECLDHEQTQEYLLYLQMMLAILK